MFSLIQSAHISSDFYLALCLVSIGNLSPKLLRPGGEADQSLHLAANKECVDLCLNYICRHVAHSNYLTLHTLT